MSISNSEEFQKELEREGFAVAPRLLEPGAVDEIVDAVEERISSLAAGLDVDRQCYSSVVSAWRSQSPVVEAIRDRAVNAAAPVVQGLIGDDAEPEKIELIRKPEGRSRPTPCHQDGTYSPDNAYALSVWIALDEADETSGCLEFLPGSHHDELCPPVDYWKPDFTDDVAQSRRWRSDAIAVSVDAGDAVLFKPFVWHRSCPIETNKPRRAIAMRWSRPGEEWCQTIPTPEPAKFGMYNCGDLTWKVLQSAYRDLFGTTHEDWEPLRDSWQARLKNRDVGFLDTRRALQSLEDLQILNRAHRQHDAGDQQGIVYAQLWDDLLKPLRDWLEGTDGTEEEARS